jgi:hypothetical protein
LAIVKRAAPTSAGDGPMNAVGITVKAVKNSRNGIRRPPRSLSAPRIGETSALMPTLIAIARPTTSWPGPWPNRLSAVSHRPIAVETTA